MSRFTAFLASASSTACRCRCRPKRSSRGPIRKFSSIRCFPICAILQIRRADIHILDLGTGTGAICLALLSECPEASGVGSDISADALRTAQSNAERNGLRDRFEAIQSSWFENIDGTFHAIVSNPPYIASKVIHDLAPEVTKFDPAAALDGGADGLDAYKAIAKDAARFMRPHGRCGT